MANLNAINFMTQDQFENVTQDDNQLYAVRGMNMIPSSKYVDLTLGASGSTYTAPANGWFIVSKRGTAGGWLSVSCQLNGIYQYSNVVTSSANNAEASQVVPVIKGSIITLSYSTTISGESLRCRILFSLGN